MILFIYIPNNLSYIYENSNNESRLIYTEIGINSIKNIYILSDLFSSSLFISHTRIFRSIQFKLLGCESNLILDNVILSSDSSFFYLTHKNIFNQDFRQLKSGQTSAEVTSILGSGLVCQTYVCPFGWSSSNYIAESLAVGGQQEDGSYFQTLIQDSVCCWGFISLYVGDTFPAWETRMEVLFCLQVSQ